MVLKKHHVRRYTDNISTYESEDKSLAQTGRDFTITEAMAASVAVIRIDVPHLSCKLCPTRQR